MSQSRCHWAGEKGPDSKRKRIFSPPCPFENTTFFKDHGACINMIPCEFGAHGVEGQVSWSDLDCNLGSQRFHYEASWVNRKAASRTSKVVIVMSW